VTFAKVSVGRQWGGLPLAAVLFWASTSGAALAQQREEPRARVRREAPPTKGGDGIGVFTQPLGVLFMAVDSLVYVPVGVEVPLGPRLDLVVQVSASSGRWYTCDSHAVGGCASAGVAWYTSPRKALSRGWFVEPLLVGRYLSTSGARVNPGDYFRLREPCTASDVANVDDFDAELHAGVDVGYSMRVGAFELAVPVVGISAGWCIHCFGGSAFFIPLSRYFAWETTALPPRKNRISMALDLNIVRVGARF